MTSETRPFKPLNIAFLFAEVNIPADMEVREYAPRQRRPLGEVAFAGEWAKAITP